MSRLVDERETLEASNTLLSQLRIQQKQLHQANSSLATINRFRIQVEKEADRAIKSFSAIDSLAEVQDSHVKLSAGSPGRRAAR